MPTAPKKSKPAAAKPSSITMVPDTEWLSISTAPVAGYDTYTFPVRPAPPVEYITPTEYALRQAATEATAATEALRKSCAHALVCGLSLAWLHQNSADPTGGQSNLKQGTTTVVNAGENEGFKYALEQTGVQSRTAYRWINAAANALARESLDIHDMPEPGSDEWEKWTATLRAAGEGMSLRRLMLGMVKLGTEEARLDELIDRSEQDDHAATAALEAVAEGKFTLVQAMRAAAGAAATAGKERRDPVYLALDGRTGQLHGLLPKALITVNNAFSRWQDLDEPARRAVRSAWIELVSHLPQELI